MDIGMLSCCGGPGWDLQRGQGKGEVGTSLLMRRGKRVKMIASQSRVWRPRVMVRWDCRWPASREFPPRVGLSAWEREDSGM